MLKLVPMRLVSPFIKPVQKIAVITGCIAALYELSNLLLVYRYFKFEYYLAAAVLLALVTGVVLTKKYYSNERNNPITENKLAHLTSKELHVLSLINEGKSNKEIAALNFVEVSTIKTHINNIYAKLCVNKRKDASEVYRQCLHNQKSTFSPPKIV
jgi:DNA-binding CsgD family transcriptional regulator